MKKRGPKQFKTHPPPPKQGELGKRLREFRKQLKGRLKLR